MMWRNTPDAFGLISRLIHWGMAILLLSLLALGLRLSDMQPGLSNLWLYGLHKTMGLTALALVLLRLVWHRLSPPPVPMVPLWQARLARLAHAAIYVLMLAIPLSGWVASSASGLDTLFAERFVMPPIAPVSEVWESAGFAVHGVLTKLLMALVGVHMLAAIKHEMDGDGTLTRMLKGRAKP